MKPLTLADFRPNTTGLAHEAEELTSVFAHLGARSCGAEMGRHFGIWVQLVGVSYGAAVAAVEAEDLCIDLARMPFEPSPATVDFTIFLAGFDVEIRGTARKRSSDRRPVPTSCEMAAA